ncbi:D-lactate dehydrogenase, oxidizes D-lactate to pyruvate, transcription is heme-dependent [Ascoidea rubescens DSM 1968]|uniref:D-lactate dehydrogenase (cytochrome) n=1 Tax=Ascoidea rubescens DSM 1968 TaxID=1344418 RepID=A0A1D2VG14_9ASCO|nr:D-lactate dehydrogenase, oxidizes D-lactate to pyruvate, transcription is heme-dependent [Ascoidea rubescens DSM 1968]ODV60576.1 D-lactate dehydrogenase, oxidizes D-lactate to pyruvate, transcription is heme-dependent [Ascoidea rubescens DSM 1968]
MFTNSFRSNPIRNQLRYNLKNFKNPNNLKNLNNKRFYSEKSKYFPKESPREVIGRFATWAALFTIGLAYGSYRTVDKIHEHPLPHLFPNSSITPLDDLLKPVYGSTADFEKAFKEVIELLPEGHTSTSQSELDHHSDTYWNSHHATDEQRPAMIVWPESTEEVSKILKICNSYKIPVTPYSGGTSLEGHFIPTRGGICLDLNKMNHILSINESDLDITLQPSVGWEDLEEYLHPKGLLFGPDPGPGAEIGGMIATSCSGTNAARYGTMKENVLSLTVVLADGTIIKTKKRPRKSAAGYNLTGLFIGSEGTLGVVTEATLRLNVRPQNETVAVVPFPSIEDAAKSVEQIVSKGIQVNAVELLDDEMMKCINISGETSKTWVEKPTLFFKLAGSKNGLKEMVSTVKDITKGNNGIDFEFANTEEERQELWAARKVALWSTINYGKTLNPDIQVWTTDVAVPVSKLANVLKETKDDMKKSGLTATLVGHVGDGNFHAFLLYDKETRKTAEDLVERMVHRALENEGTCTGEHGVGYGKRDFLINEIGQDPISLMRKIKMALDPNRILNADKVFRIDPDEPLVEHK